MDLKPGTFGWYEHHSDDAKSVRDFYSKIFPYKMEATDMEDHEDYTAMVGDQAIFGMIQSYPGMEGSSGWMPYIVVENCEKSMNDAIEAGADLIVPREEAEGYGSFCVVRDPWGALLAIFEPGEE
ncbi:MAG: hypothetical protein KDC26_09390 [Armatimonadetes bacterium]|nr:hypothetical protein [Armatimonadota bacterium]